MIIRIQQSQRGFSLVELLLTLVLILCLAAASVFTFTTLYRSANLDEGYDRFQSLIRFAQAEAATTGHKVRLQFVNVRPLATVPSSGNKVTSTDDERGDLKNIQVTWEADVLNAPGVFQVYTNKTWSEEMVNELVGVEKVQSIQGSAAPTPSSAVPAPAPVTAPEISQELSQSSAETGPESAVMTDFPTITFYPDGSCDSAEIVLASRNPDDVRRVEIRLGGILGSVSGRTVSGEQNAADTESVVEEQEYNDLFESSSPVSSSTLADRRDSAGF